MENVSKIIQQIIGSGLTINGRIDINGLTITSTDKARELGFLSKTSQNQESQQSTQPQQEQNNQSESQGGQQSQPEEQISRDEFNNLKEEVEYLRNLSESSKQENQSRGRSSQSK